MDTKLLYLDESGDSGWLPDHGGNSTEPYLIYGGVVLSPAQNHLLKQELHDIINKYFSSPMDRPEEIHYADICHHNGPYSQLSNEESSDLRDDLFELILDIEPMLMGMVIDKYELKEEYGAYANPPKRLAFRAIADRFHKQLQSDDAVGMITMDASERSIDARLRELIYQAQDSGIKLDGASSKYDSTLPRIMDTVTVTPSEMSPGIQLADIVAYQIRHQYRYDNDSHGFQAIEHLFRDPDGYSLTEPAIFPD
ncbi:DUF3800 domain-containing protein [Natrinema saccharevitans]|uniref:DUF3800 domain-containing protein n=1 Tax=Natrinema saccharevitans TaxID=301967 RepID=UPI0009700CCB|nr:DUF3800 domain-containing protein [Natrinema saccharevitans]